MPTTDKKGLPAKYFRKPHWLWKNPHTKLPKRIILLHAASAPDKGKPGRSSPLQVGLEREGLAHTGVPATTGNRVLLAAYASLCSVDTDGTLTEVEWWALYEPEVLWKRITGLDPADGFVWVIAHDMGVFARLLDGFTWLSRLGWTGDSIIPNTHCLLLSWRQGKHKLKLIDSQNHLRGDLRQMASWEGVKIGPDRFSEGDREKALAHCRQCVTGLTAMWDRYFRFLVKNDLGNFAISIAGQAFNAFRHRLGDTKIAINGFWKQEKLGREAFFGGRCQVFQAGHFTDGPYYKLDQTGAYPWAMRTFRYPSKGIGRAHGCSLAVLAEGLKRHLCIAEVVLETDVPRYAARVGKKTRFPVGTFHTVLTSPDLRTACVAGAIRAVGRVEWFQGDDLFSKYVDEMIGVRMQARADGDRQGEQVSKILCNAIYGKLAQKGYHQKIIGECPPETAWAEVYLDGETGNWLWHYAFGGKIVEQRQTSDSFNSFAGLSAHITAHLRSYLYDIGALAGWANVFYVDTDALVINQAGYDRLAHLVKPNVLGMLKIEDQADEIEIWGQKRYRIGDNVTLAGLKPGAVRREGGAVIQRETQELRTALKWRQPGTVIERITRKWMRPRAGTNTATPTGPIPSPAVELTPTALVELLSQTQGGNAPLWWVEPEWGAGILVAASDAIREAALKSWQETGDAHDPDWTLHLPTPGLVCVVDGAEHYSLRGAFNAAIEVQDG